MNENISYTLSGMPKIIHQTWKDNDIPDKWKKSQREWIRLHPDWIYILWTDKDIRNHIANHHPEFLDLHDSYEYPIQRADMIRYFVLYDYGGVYSDLDLYPTQNIEPYLSNWSDYFVFSANTDCFTNSLMISTKNSQIMKEIIDNLKSSSMNLKWWSIGKHLKVMNTTGPLFLTNILLNTNHNFCVLPKSKFNPYSVDEDFNENKKNVVIHTLQGSSWHSWDSSIYNFVFKNRPIFITLGIIFILFVIIGLIYYISKYRKCKESKDKCEKLCKF
jgi:mannosyltransferase OCH1-like enzyme